MGEFAKLLYPSGHLIDSKDHASAEAQTREWLAQEGEIILFEPAIRFENLFIRIDVLIKRGNTFELIEVKAKSYDSLNPEIERVRTPILSGMLPYLQDVAFQKYVLAQAFPGSAIASYLMMPDKSVNATIDGLNQLFKVRRKERSTEVIQLAGAEQAVARNPSLLAKVNVDRFVDSIMNGGIEYPGGHAALPHLAAEWSKEYELDQKIAPVLHAGCAKCEFRAEAGDGYLSGYHECVQATTGLSEEEINQGTVLDIWNFRRKDDLIASGVIKLSQASEEDLKVKDDKDGLSNSQRQWLQCNGIPRQDDLGGFYLDRGLINHQMAQWVYPLHMIDFETSTTALPFFKGMGRMSLLLFNSLIMSLSLMDPLNMPRVL